MQSFVNNIMKIVVGIAGMSFRYPYTEFNDPVKHLRVVKAAKDNAIPIVIEILEKTKENYCTLKELGEFTSFYATGCEEIVLACIKLLGLYTESTEIIMRAPPNDLALKLSLAQRIILAKRYLEPIKDYRMSEGTEKLYTALQEELTSLETRLIKIQANHGIVFNPHHLIGKPEIKKQTAVKTV